MHSPPRRSELLRGQAFSILSDSDNPLFKGQTLKTKIADAVLSVSRANGVELTSDYETSARETIRLGDIVSSPLIVSDGGNTVNFSFENVINTQAARL